jgi:hypothetical protein
VLVIAILMIGVIVFLTSADPLPNLSQTGCSVRTRTGKEEQQQHRAELGGNQTVWINALAPFNEALRFSHTIITPGGTVTSAPVP